MARPLKPFVRGGGYYPSAKYTPLVYPGGYTTLNAKNGKPEPLNTFVGKIVQFLAKRSLPMVKLEANFTPIQNLNGQDAPYPPGGGKNKIDILRRNSGGILAEKDETGRLKITGTATGTVYVDFQTVDLPSGNYVFSVSGLSTGLTCVYTKNGAYGGNITSELAITLSEQTTVGGYISIENGTTVNTTVALQLESGSTPTAFAPYSNICPISGHTGCDVVRTGKNLFPGATGRTNAGITFTVNEDGSVTCSGVASANALSSTVRFNDLKPGTYKKSPAVNGTGLYVQYETSPSWTAVTGGDITSDTFTLDADMVSKYNVIFRIRVNNGTDLTTPLTYYPYIYLGDETDLTWESPVSDSVTVSFGTTVYGGQLTVNEDGSGQIDASMALADLGAMDWRYESAWGAFASSLPDAKRVNSAQDANWISSIFHLKGAHYSGSTAPDLSVDVNSMAHSAGTITIKDTAYTTGSDFKTAMNGQTLCYELATPITIPLTASQINTLVGENVVWVNNSDNIQVTAYGSPID